jgi:NAD(P)-dependent dehydrogenase (short-subunit alcohol dehydrogenase family)
MQTGPAVFLAEYRGFANPVIAEALAAAGARVVAADPEIPEDGGEAGIRFLGWTDPGVLVRRAAEMLGRLDAVVIAPAMPAPRTPVEALTLASLEPYYMRIAAASLVMAGAAAEVMRPQKAGRILFCTSSGPIGGIPGFVAYASARAAVNGAVRTLALELAADGVSVNAVAPNFIQTETYYPKALLEDPVKGPKLLSRVPMGRLGEAQEVADLVTHLALGRAGFISGQVINISGAWS